MNILDNDLNHVLIVKEITNQRIFILKDRSEYSLGRSSRNQIVIKDKQVSRYHATIVKKNKANSQESFWIYDGDRQNKKSTNGLIVNQKKCYFRCLQKGDLIKLGENVCLEYYQFPRQTLELIKATANQKKSPSKGFNKSTYLAAIEN